ncbi:hypothetical protein LX64_03049 [Chitinophaga skermanii]|uniref:Uncharacterized protein n=1 Tax=Chitinophaga skermanii TaxID=331697 RepID=A0A327QIT4_9BACT|nr:hypothetical protein LX64_03049 [Chitinophaga skermanii]
MEANIQYPATGFVFKISTFLQLKNSRLRAIFLSVRLPRDSAWVLGQELLPTAGLFLRSRSFSRSHFRSRA